MEWTKIPIDLLQSRKSDKEIIAITKYQILWAMLERKPDDETALRYMTSKQLQQAHNYSSAIECRVNADIKSVESHRKRQKIFYEKNQSVRNVSDGQCDGQYDGHSNAHTDVTDKIRLDKNRLDNIEKKNNKKEKKFIKPSIEEIKIYCNERKNNISAEQFFDFYESKGWKIGNSPMKDWQAAIRTWEKKNTNRGFYGVESGTYGRDIPL